MKGLIFQYFQTLRVNTRGFYIQEGLGGHHENIARKKLFRSNVILRLNFGNLRKLLSANVGAT